MRYLSLWLLVLAGCNFDSSADTAASDASQSADADPALPDGALIDAMADANLGPDAAPDAMPCETWTKAPLLFDPCDISVRDDDLHLNIAGTYVYNTDLNTLALPDAGGTITPSSALVGLATAVVVGRFQIDSGVTLRVIGTRPLLLVSWNEMVIDGAINVRSTPRASAPDNPAMDLRGAGADPTACLAAGNGTTESNGGSGGGGGGFGSVGGSGGNGRVNGQNTAGGAGGMAAAFPPKLRGGCPGGAGGNGDGVGAGAGGHGGGAVYLNARTTITLSGTIHAGGSGGHRAVGGRSAGGGGGSGGLVGVEAQTITILASAVLAANGGGGGGGGDDSTSASLSGDSGRLGDLRAAGGLGESKNPSGHAGDGGFLSDDTVASKDGDPGERGGGGAGGGVGVIVLSSMNSTTQAGAVISPVHTTVIAQ